jgi:hypothetical protein
MTDSIWRVNQQGELVARVIAMSTGFYDGSRVRAGQEFDMRADAMKRTVDENGDTLYILPSWVKGATDLSRRLFAKQKVDAEQKAADAAIASSGGGVARKHKTFLEAMNAGRGPQLEGGDKAAAAAIASSGTEGNKAKKQAIREAENAGRGPQTPVR